MLCEGILRLFGSWKGSVGKEWKKGKGSLLLVKAF